MLDEALKKCADNSNYTIYTSMCKAQRILMRSYDPVCSISGDSDSDIVLDLIHKVDEDSKVKYFWIDTGLEYTATKEHLAYLEQKYGITIERVKPDKPIPTCVKQYGVPFLSKYVSEQMMRLQSHGFQWEDEPLEVLLQKYSRCKTALQWWCGERYSDKDGIQKISRFSIYRNRFLKEFIMANPPDFPISNKCCEYAKKKPAKRIVKEHDADLDITGIRQSEGGIRSAAFKTCFSECKSKGCNTFRPVFWYTDVDKRDYEEMFGVTHSRCYTEYGLRRTGCVGCPFSKHINEELAIIEKHEPMLYKAAVNIFGKSYEYTAKYRAFVKEMKAKERKVEFMSRIGYIRVSTEHQETARQQEIMDGYHVDRIFSEKLSGANADRPQLKAMLDYVREGDTLYIESISRLGRSTKDLLNIIDTLSGKGVTHISHKENIDTDTPTGKFMLTVFAALSQLEREQLKQRQREGIEIAKAQGKYTGRKPIEIDWTRFGQLYGEWKSKSITGRDFMRRMGLSANTFYRRVREYEAEHGIAEPTSA